MGESKGTLANTSLVVVISGRYARPRSQSVLQDVVVAGDAPTLDVEVSHGRQRSRTVITTRDLKPIVECWLNLSGAIRRSRALGRH